MSVTPAPKKRTATAPERTRLPRSVARSTAAGLFAAAFIVYNANLRPISSADTFPTRYLPISILKEADFDLDEFPFLLKQEYRFPGADSSGLPYYLQRRRGHLLSPYPVMPAILATPVYALPVFLGLTGDPQVPAPAHGFTRTEIVGTLLGKVAASLATALSVMFVFWSSCRLTSRRGAVWIALGYAFATSSWSVSAQGLWQTTMSQMLLAAAILAFLKAREADPLRWIAVAGTLLGLAVACRPPAIIFALILSLYAWRAHRQEFLRAFVPVPAVLAILLVTYNVFHFGRLTGAYEGYVQYSFSVRHMAGALYGLLLSPNRGMIIFSPVLLAGYAGLGVALRRREHTLQRYLAAATLATLIFYSSIVQWDAGFSYSYRFLVDVLPGLAVGAALAWDWIRARRWRVATMASLFAVSVGMQVVGAFFYPCGWYRSTLNDRQAMARMFSWRDLEVAQCLRSGPVEPDGLRLLLRRMK